MVIIISVNIIIFTYCIYNTCVWVLWLLCVCVCLSPGAHVNPAVSLAMVVLGKLPLKKFPVYVLAQFLGAFAGSCAVYALYYGEQGRRPDARMTDGRVASRVMPTHTHTTSFF